MRSILLPFSGSESSAVALDTVDERARRVEDAVRLGSAQRELDDLKARQVTANPPGGVSGERVRCGELIGGSPAMNDVYEQLETIRFATYDNFRVVRATDNFIEKYLPFQI